MHLAKAVANAAAALVLKAKNVAQKTEDSTQQNRVIAAATQCALSTSQLVACTRVSAPPETGARGTPRSSSSSLNPPTPPSRWWRRPSAPRCARSS